MSERERERARDRKRNLISLVYIQMIDNIVSTHKPDWYATKEIVSKYPIPHVLQMM